MLGYSLLMKDEHRRAAARYLEVSNLQCFDGSDAMLHGHTKVTTLW